MQRSPSDEQFAPTDIEENNDFWSLINLGDDAANSCLLIPSEEWWTPDNRVACVAPLSSDSSPSSEAYCDNVSSIRTMNATEPGIEGADNDDDSARATQKRAKRQAQNRVAQQAFRARKEKLVRSLSVELASLQCQFASTKAENEQLHNDLRLVRAELSAIRSVLQHAQPSPISGKDDEPFLETEACGVSGDSASSTLTLRIPIDGLLSERWRTSLLKTMEGYSPAVSLKSSYEPSCYR